MTRSPRRLPLPPRRLPPSNPAATGYLTSQGPEFLSGPFFGAPGRAHRLGGGSPLPDRAGSLGSGSRISRDPASFGIAQVVSRTRRIASGVVGFAANHGAPRGDRFADRLLACATGPLIQFAGFADRFAVDFLRIEDKPCHQVHSNDEFYRCEQTAGRAHVGLAGRWDTGVRGRVPCPRQTCGAGGRTGWLPDRAGYGVDGIARIWQGATGRRKQGTRRHGRRHGLEVGCNHCWSVCAAGALADAGPGGTGGNGNSNGG